VVDTAGAGDAFCGVLAAGLAAKCSLDAAVARACIAGALATTRPGTAASSPTAAELQHHSAAAETGS
jgi:ribokinase